MFENVEENLVTIRLAILGNSHPVAVQYKLDRYWDHPEGLRHALDAVVEKAMAELKATE